MQELAHRRIALVPLRAFAGLLDHRFVLLRQHVGQAQRVFLRALAGLVLHQVDEVDLVAGLDPVFGEIDDDVETFGDALGGQDGVVVLTVAIAVQVHAAVERHCVFHDVAVVGDQVKRHTGIGHTRAGRPRELATIAGDFTHHGKLEVARHRTIEDTQAIAARPHFQARLVLPVDQDLVAEKAIGVERVEP
ncbi:hypothetical protein D3C77_265540 [compost metagenome]